MGYAAVTASAECVAWSPHRANVEGIPDTTIVEAASRDAAHSTAWQLADAKRDRNRAIDARSRELIAQGFTFDGHQFSLSDHAQRNWMDLIVNGLVTDPQPISTITDDVYMLASEDLAAIYAAGRTQVVTVLGSGQQLKAAVNACETVAEVNAIEDNR